jgi:hypothetical protein
VHAAVEVGLPQTVSVEEVLYVPPSPVVAELRPFDDDHATSGPEGMLGHFDEAAPEELKKLLVSSDLAPSARGTLVDTVPWTPASAGNRSP